MFKKFAIAAFVGFMSLGSINANAIEPVDIVVCEARQNLALHIMGARQNDFSAEEVAKAANSPIGHRLTREAFREPIEKSHAEQVESLVNFAEKEYNRCIEEKSI